MAKTKEQKKEIVEKYKNLIKGSKALYFTKPENLTANEINDFRKQLHEQEASYNVVKNTLLKLALNEQYEVDESLLSGRNALVFVQGDPPGAAKALKEFADETDKVEISIGFLGDRRISKEEVERLATLPSKEELIATLMVTMKSPVHGLVNVIQGPQRKLVYVLKAIKEQRGKET